MDVLYQKVKIPFINKYNPSDSFMLEIEKITFGQLNVPDFFNLAKKHYETKRNYQKYITHMRTLYNHFDLSKSIEYYHDSFPVYFNAKDKLDKNFIKIFVNVIDLNQTYSIFTHPQNTLAGLYAEIRQQLGLTLSSIITLQFQNGVALFEDSSQLNEFGIKDQDTIECYFQNIGGGALFADLTNKEGVKNIQFSQNAPLYRACVPGLNIEGICQNSQCGAFGKQVICRIGTGTFDLIEDEGAIKCPICKQFFQPKTCGFCECSYTFTGIKKMTKQSPPVKVAMQEWSHVGHSYTYYDPRISGEVIWSKLKIYTQDDQQVHKPCWICQQEMQQENCVITKKECNHQFHQKCLDVLSDELKAQMTCFVCSR